MELQKFFAACHEREVLVYKFFLLSGCREKEAAHTEVRDLLFADGVLWIRPKRERAFRLKGKKGRASLGRKVPMPAAFMRQLEVICQGQGEHDLLFPNTEGRVEGHFLRKCQVIAKRAGLTGFELHRWRKSFATRLHESGLSVRKIQAYLGHTTLDVTLIYLGVADAADEASQEQINNTKFAQMFA